MTFLTRLNLPENHVEGEIPSSIGKLCYLMHFDISSNNVTGTISEILKGTDCLSRKPLPSLQDLDLSSNNLVGKLPEWLGQPKNLVELHLLYNSRHGPIPASLGLTKILSVLWLGRNELNGTLLESLGQLSKLILLMVLPII
ncbi:DNA damage-repair/toleration protein DRT100-like [Ziziphus jujuba]|uniref:DNA damage-repair/toleration protein DRT100-like n=1 Tax=Ziziphus jujuba TaxID=326968 RepID=A0ABM3IJJ3_ZIZJJ|nr:DNA damage-repair/toleration protein DRT100-like [Ziziphus jujuba]